MNTSSTVSQISEEQLALWCSDWAAEGGMGVLAKVHLQTLVSHLLQKNMSPAEIGNQLGRAAAGLGRMGGGEPSSADAAPPTAKEAEPAPAAPEPAPEPSPAAEPPATEQSELPLPALD